MKRRSFLAAGVGAVLAPFLPSPAHSAEMPLYHGSSSLAGKKIPGPSGPPYDFYSPRILDVPTYGGPPAHAPN